MAHFLRDGGTFYIAELHPWAWVMDDTGEQPEPGARYFHDDEPLRWEQHGSYVGEPRHFDSPTTYEWNHSLGDIVSALIDAGSSSSSSTNGRSACIGRSPRWSATPRHLAPARRPLAPAVLAARGPPAALKASFGSSR